MYVQARACSSMCAPCDGSNGRQPYGPCSVVTYCGTDACSWPAVDVVMVQMMLSVCSPTTSAAGQLYVWVRQVDLHISDAPIPSF